jgi:hypothetical protein
MRAELLASSALRGLFDSTLLSQVFQALHRWKLRLLLCILRPKFLGEVSWTLAMQEQFPFSL